MTERDGFRERLLQYSSTTFKCQNTGHPWGTDTVRAGSVCPCAVCLVLAAVHLEAARLHEEETKALERLHAERMAKVLKLAEEKLLSAHSEAAALRERVAKLEEALGKAAEKFREYEQIHRAKFNPMAPVLSCEDREALRKTEANRRMAEMCEEALK